MFVNDATWALVPSAGLPLSRLQPAATSRVSGGDRGRGGPLTAPALRRLLRHRAHARALCAAVQ